jgi:ATP-dependent Lon protease
MLKRLSISILGDKDKISGDIEADTLLKECDQIIKELNDLTGSKSKIFSTFRDLLKKRNLKNKKNKEITPNTYIDLTSKVQSMESQLRNKLASLTEIKSALLDQAIHLKSRLESCIEYNFTKLEAVCSFIDEFKEIFQKLKLEQTSIIAMRKFNQEIEQQLSSQESKGKLSKTWSYVMNSMKISPKKSDEEIFLSEKLEKINKCMSDFDAKLSIANEQKNIFSSNLSSCNSSRDNINGLDSGLYCILLECLMFFFVFVIIIIYYCYYYYNYYLLFIFRT